MKTGHRPSNPRCTLARFIPNSIDTEAAKRDGWQLHNYLVVHADDKRLTWIEQQIVAGIGKKLYGER